MVGPPSGESASRSGDDGVLDHAAAAAFLCEVRPHPLNREDAGRERDVLNTAASRCHPGAEVADLLAIACRPAARRELIGDGFGVLMALNDGDSIELIARIHQPRTAAGAGVRDVREIGEREQLAGGGAATIQRRIAGVVVPGAETALLVLVWVRAGGGHDDVLRITVGCGGRVAEMRGRVLSLDGDLVGTG